jgi:uncharacterized protein (TIGR04255 family)
MMAIFKPAQIRKKETPPLLQSPLIEAIFEIRWELQTDEQTKRMRDSSYPMMYGSIYERLKKDFPVIEDLPSTQAHPESTPFTPRHRMRKEKDGYPLIQVGPGIVTVNMAKKYAWGEFNALIVRLIECINDLYPTNATPINFIKSELRFVNGIQFDIAKENPLAFLAEKLHLKVEPDAEFFEVNPIADKPNSVGLNLAYVLDKPAGNLVISANLGQFDGKPAFIQQTLIQSFGEITPVDLDGFTLWLEEAHTAAENCFQVLCKDALMERFCCR